MNIVQLHERVRFWLDVVASPRYEPADLDNAINAAINDKVRESYDPNRPINRSDTFQRVQRVRDELGSLVKKATIGDGLSIVTDANNKTTVISLTSKTGHIPEPQIEDFGWILSFRVKFTKAGWQPAIALTYNRKNVLPKNPYRRVRTTPEVNVYYIEDESGWNILHDLYPDDGVEEAEIYYLANPTPVYWGNEYDSTKVFSSQDPVGLIAIEETVYAGTTYPIGKKFYTDGVHSSITSGLIVADFVDAQIAQTSHEEIARRAAINTLLTSGQFEKAGKLREEILAS